MNEPELGPGVGRFEVEQDGIPIYRRLPLDLLSRITAISVLANSRPNLTSSFTNIMNSVNIKLTRLKTKPSMSALPK